MEKTLNLKLYQEILQNLEVQAKKLAVLLHDSTMPDDVKMAWLAILPKMSLEQIDRFLNILEARYLDEKTRNIDKRYKKELEKIVKDFENEKKRNDKELLKNLNEIKKLI